MHLLFLLLIILFSGEKLSLADSLLKSSNCLLGKSNSFPNIKNITAIKSSCNQKCESFCKSKFKLDKMPNFDNMTPSQRLETERRYLRVKEEVIKVNQDKIEECFASCYKGQSYEDTIRVPILLDDTGRPENDPKKPQIWACEIHPNSQVLTVLDLDCTKGSDKSETVQENLCSPDEIEDNFLDSELTLNKGAKVMITLVNPTDDSSEQNLLGDNNNLYLCGFKTKFFLPNYFDLEGNEISKGDLFYQKPLQTDFTVRDGDYLAINYLGRYYSSCPNKECNFNQEDYNLLINLGDKKLQLKASGRTNSDELGITNTNKCSDCLEKPDSDFCKSNFCKSIFIDTNDYGFQHITSYAASPQIFLEKFNKTYDSPQQFRNNSIVGLVKDFSPTSKPITIGYNNGSDKSRGGYFTSISWRGCNYSQGERLEYLVVNNRLINHENFNLYMKDFAPWKSFLQDMDKTSLTTTITVTDLDLAIPDLVDFESVRKDSINQESKGAIFFRIKRLTDDESKVLSLKEGAKNQVIGSYKVKINTEQNSLLLTGLLEKLLTKTILDLPEITFKFITKNPVYINFLQALLVFYIAFMAFSFMIGISQLNQSELIMKILKFTFVLMLLSEGSFEFFSGNFLQLFTIETMNNLANIVTPRIDTSFGIGLEAKGDCFADPAAKIKLLCVMEQDLLLGFSGPVWIRILGIAFSGLFLPAIGIAIGLFLYVFIVVKITFMYFAGILLLVISISLAPFFMPFILFKYTRGFFDGWVKQLMVLTIQPMMIFTAISLFRLLFMQVVQIIFGVNVCKICLFSIPIVGCIFYPYIPLSIASASTGGSVFMVSSLLTLFIIGYGMNSFYVFAANLSKRLINFAAKTLGESKVGITDLAGQAKNLSSTFTKPIQLLAIDKNSRQTRARDRQAAITKNKRGK